jgi:TRAP-type C4-dicarboxylate transport system substrate-binding protein
MRRLLSAVCIPLLGPALAACSPASTGETWRFAIEEAPGSVQHTYATRLEAEIEDRLPDVDVKIYTYGTLGTSNHISELLHNGTLQLAFASPGHLGKLIPEVQVFLLHFVFSDDEAVNDAALTDPAVHAILDPLYAEKGYDLLTLFSEGWMVWTLDRVVREPEDFQGVKMRTMTSPLLLAAYRAYGASPTPLPYSEVYSALQLSMIDGQVNPVFAIEEMSFYEVTDAMVFADHAPFITTLAANRDFVEGLPPERREALDEVVEALQPEILATQQRLARERLARIRENAPDLELVELGSEARAAFREAARPVRDRYLSAAPRGEAVLDALEAAVARARADAVPAPATRTPGP